MAAPALRVLLVSANTEQSPDPVFPLGAACVGAAAIQAGHRVQALDLCFSADPRADLKAAIRAFDPQVIAFSLRNLDSTAYPECSSYIEDYRRLMQVCRACSAAPVVLGGAGFSVMPLTVLEYLGADYGVAGEGEEAFPWLLQRLARGERPVSCPDFSVAASGSAACIRSLKTPSNLDLLPRPARHLFDARRYYERGGLLNLQSKRGCQFECSYCSYPIIEGSRIRCRSAQSVADELEAGLREWGVRHWFIADSVFNAPLGHAKEVCREIIARRLDLDWAAYFNPAFFDAELAGLLRRSGCHTVEFGTDSGSPMMISSLKKSFGVSQLRQSSALCAAEGIRFCHSLVFGGPGETLDSVRETIALMDETKPTAVIAMTGLRIHPGTALARTAVAEGLLDPADTLLFPSFYVSPDLGDELIRTIEDTVKSRPAWVMPGKGFKANIAAMQALRDRKLKGQLWSTLG